MRQNSECLVVGRWKLQVPLRDQKEKSVTGDKKMNEATTITTTITLQYTSRTLTIINH
jgi:hypothetical protein